MPEAAQATRLEDLDLPVLDLRSAEYGTQPAAVLERLRKISPMVRSERGIEFLRYDDCENLFKDERIEPPSVERVAAQGYPQTILDFWKDGFLIDMPADRHDRVRRVIMKAFVLRKVETSRGMMRETAIRLLDAIIDRGACDFVDDYTHQYPIQVLCQVIGVPLEDVHVFEHASAQVRFLFQLDPDLPRAEAALRDLYEYCKEITAARRKAPQGDLISALLQAQDEEGGLTEPELLWGIANLLFAGHDTTRFQLASVVRAMLEFRGTWEAVAAQPELTMNAVNEGMRLYPAVTALTRQVRAPYTYLDTLFPTGTLLKMNEIAAGRDPERWENPDVLDLQRPGQPWDLSFGKGRHYCVGSNVARLEIAEAINVLTERLRDVEIAGPMEMSGPQNNMYGPEKMPLLFKAR